MVIAESFGRIFRINCARNGLLAIELPGETIEQLHRQTIAAPQSKRLLVDLEKLQIQSPEGDIIRFSIDESDRFMLLQGLNYIDYTMQYAGAIEDFVEKDREARPWAHL